MLLLAQILAGLACLLVAYLTFLLLFEPGPRYSVRAPVHELGDEERWRLLSTLLGAGPQRIDSMELLREGPQLYRAQLRAIEAAQRCIHLEAYILYPGEVADALLKALAERARAGVAVRVIIDDIGSFRTRKRYFHELLEAGGRVERYHSFRWYSFRRLNNRTHRNLLVIDGRVGFIGGAGIADHWSYGTPGPWRDCTLKVTGEIVGGLQAVFAENWLECAGELLVDADSFPSPAETAPSSGPEPPVLGMVVGSTPTAGRSTRARVLVQFLLASARESIDLCSPYFIPDLGIRKELRAARQRGVRVRVLTGGPYTDHGIVRRAGRRRFGSLFEAGVELWEYATRMMHAKVLLVDGRWAMLGSTNIDHRSFGLNDEVNIVVLSPQLGHQLREDFERDLAHSNALDYTTWRRRPRFERFLETLGRIIERHQ